MADPKNPGQFGNRKDTKEQASEGGHAQGKEDNPANFANRNPQERKEIAREGGEHSHGGGRKSEE